MDKKIIEKVYDKVNKDFEEINNKLMELDKQELINKSYKIAVCLNFYGNIVDYLDMTLDDEEEYIGKKYLKQIACYKDNIIDDLCKMFLNFSHPERVDFWYGGDFIQILEDCLDLIAKHKEF